MHEFKPGKIVYLDIGSPLMSVREAIDCETVICQWFSPEYQHLEHGEFHIRYSQA